jgi:hypothetical protein
MKKILMLIVFCIIGLNYLYADAAATLTAAGNVAIKINGVTYKNYSYSAGSCIPPDTIPIKLFVPKGQYLEDQLVTGTTGVHSISIVGEIVK